MNFQTGQNVRWNMHAFFCPWAYYLHGQKWLPIIKESPVCTDKSIAFITFDFTKTHLMQFQSHKNDSSSIKCNISKYEYHICLCHRHTVPRVSPTDDRLEQLGKGFQSVIVDEVRRVKNGWLPTCLLLKSTADIWVRYDRPTNDWSANELPTEYRRNRICDGCPTTVEQLIQNMLYIDGRWTVHRRQTRVVCVS